MNSTNIKVMSEEIQHLKNEVHNLDVEIPAHPATDAGKYLGVAADGSLAWSKVPDELPPTTGATAGQILALDSNKAPEWANNYNLNYSETEINTGKKWIDGKEIYLKVVTGTFETSGLINLGITVDELIDIRGMMDFPDTNFQRVFITGCDWITNTVHVSMGVNASKDVIVNLSGDNTNLDYEFTLYYTKPTPTPSALTSSDPNREAEPEIIEEPEPETKSTRTKKSTK